MKFLLSIFILLCSFISIAQDEFYSVDTLKISRRVGGEEIDSLPDYYNGILTLNPGGYVNSVFGNFSSNYENSIQRLNSTFSNDFNKRNFVYTSLPHLGFVYSFGSKGLQSLHVEYQQNITKKFGLNLYYSKNSLGEMMRGATFSVGNLLLQTRFLGIKYKQNIQLNFDKSSIKQNGGLDSSNSVLEFPLTFLKVNKTNASSVLKGFYIELDQRYNFLKDSLKELGLVLNSNFSIKNRIYVEEDDLSLIYSNVYIDSFQTRDQFQLGKASNFAGVYLKRNHLCIESGFNHTYWKFQNLGTNRDTVELGAKLNLFYRSKNIVFSNYFYRNFVGAKGETSEKFNLYFKANNYKLIFDGTFTQKLPEPFQRTYFSNNYSWSNKQLKLQENLNLNARFRLDLGYELEAKVSYASSKNNYFFNSTNWNHEVLSSLNVLSFSVKGGFNFGRFKYQPLVIINQFSEEYSFIPKFDIRNRIAYSKKLFKAQKMNFIVAADLSYQSQRDLLLYVNALDVYEVSNLGLTTNPSLYKIDFFTGFQIETFRFYVKAENLNYIWNKTDDFNQVNIPISPFFVRIGLTWDFFN